MVQLQRPAFLVTYESGSILMVIKEEYVISENYYFTVMTW